MTASHQKGISAWVCSNLLCWRQVVADVSFCCFRLLLGSFKAPANEDTLLPTQMFPRLPARATFVADTNFVSGTQKLFLILFRNILCPQQMFPSLRSTRNIMGNNVSTTMCPRLPGPLFFICRDLSSNQLQNLPAGLFDRFTRIHSL